MKRSCRALAIGIVGGGLLLVGCGEKAGRVASGENQMIFDTEVPIAAETIPFEQLIAPECLALKQGMLVAASIKADMVLNIYETPSLEHRYGNGRKGRGPGEYSSFVLLCKSPKDNNLNVWGLGDLSFVRTFDLSSPDSVKTVADLEIGKFDVFNDMNLIADSIIVYYDMRNLSVKKYDMVRHQELGQIVFEKDPHGEPFFYSNRGMVLCNDSLIIYVYNFKKQIDLYDLHTLALKKRISDGKQYDIPIPSMTTPVPKQYYNVYASEQFFYTLTGGNADIPTLNVKTMIEQFDYQGNPIARYVPDKAPGMFVVDEKQRMIYGYHGTIEPDGWLRYKLPN